MEALAKRYPSDVDVSVLYAESVMDTPTGRSPLSDQDLEKLLAGLAQHDFSHLGALHCYIHVAEWNDHALHALAAANTLRDLNLAPEASHLIHMPSHVFAHLGTWKKVEVDNRRAVDMDERQAATRGIAPTDLDYYGHNIDFWYGGAVMRGDEKEARTAANRWDAQHASSDWGPSFEIVAAERFGHHQEAADFADQIARKGELLKRAWKPSLMSIALAYAAVGRIADARKILVEIRTYKKTRGGSWQHAADLVEGRIADVQGDAQKASEFYLKDAKEQDRSFEDSPPWTYAPRELAAAMQLRLGEVASAASLAAQDFARAPPTALFL